jgi:hypothetical protein
MISHSPPSTRTPTQGFIFWDPNDAYRQTFGKERLGRMHGVGVRCTFGSIATSSSAPQVSCNVPKHVDMTRFAKEFDTFKAAFENIYP